MVFALSKGATPEMLAILEEGMKNYARVIRNQLGIDVTRSWPVRRGLELRSCVFLEHN